MMKKQFTMSFFDAPITNVVPQCECSVEQVYQLITRDETLRLLTEQVRNAADLRRAKASLLPFVTPCGTFSRRNSQSLVAPSGLVVIDVDHLDSYDEAVAMRRALFDDPLLHPVLTFISPSGRGVKAFVPYDTSSTLLDASTAIVDAATEAALQVNRIVENLKYAMEFTRLLYDNAATSTAPTASRKGVDLSGKDIVRACFLSYDADALFRNEA
jgi:hypothetical protein